VRRNRAVVTFSNGVDPSEVIGNNSHGNAGGVLLTDETGPTHDNLIKGNTVEDNAYDCGIAMASHGPASITGSEAPFGVYSNTITGNISHHNGTGLPGAGVGVGLFAPGPLNQTYANVVSGNRLTENGLPGVAIHNHAPANNINLSNNVVIGNYIAGNGPDGGVETASNQQVPTGISVLGVSPINGLIITQNWIEGESTVIVITNSGASVDVSLNALTGNRNGIVNLPNPITTSPPGLVFAAENRWGCQDGPGTSGCSSVSGPDIVSTPFLPSRRRLNRNNIGNRLVALMEMPSRCVGLMLSY
jgi:hypothetical protein